MVSSGFLLVLALICILASLGGFLAIRKEEKYKRKWKHFRETGELESKIILNFEFTEKERYYHKNIVVENCNFEECVHIADFKNVDNLWDKLTLEKKIKFYIYFFAKSIDKMQKKL